MRRAYNKPDIGIGDGFEFVTRSGLACTVLYALNDKDYLIRFSKSGQVQTASFWSIYKRTVIDHLTEKKFGIGFAKGTIQQPLDCKGMAFARWSNILYRCYSGKVHGYENVSMCDEWHNFENFKTWFDLELGNLPNNSDIDSSRFVIDKDLFYNNVNQVYSPDTCCIIPSELNCVIKHFHWENGKITGMTQRKLKACQSMLDKFGNVITDRVKQRLITLISQCDRLPQSQLSAIIWYNGEKYNAKTLDELKSIISKIETI